MNYTVATLQNRRSYQEDRYFIKSFPQGTLMGVFDGHGGKYTAEYSAEHTSDIFKTLFDSKKYDELTLLEKTIEQLNLKTIDMVSGSTASLVWVDNNYQFAYVAILGDSPVIIKDASNTIWLSPEHNVRTNYAEGNYAIKNLNGMIKHGYLYDKNKPWEYGIQMSRALGDNALSNVLIRKPEVFKVPLNNSSWIICGSDGLLDPGHENTAAVLHNITLLADASSTTADTLIKCAKNAGSYDNITCILMKY
jgi:serine/threonine protein phosphatase PrpC